MKAFSVIALCVFGIVFSVFVALTGFVPELPPGNMIGGIWGCVLNGIVYGVVVWIIYAVVVTFFAESEPVGYRSEPIRGAREAVKVEVPMVHEETFEVEPKAGVPIIEVEGIGKVYADKLNSVGIVTTTDLLEAGKTRARREELSEETGISEKLILEWVNLSDLMRIKGVGEEYSDLLEEAGVDTVVELSRRVPENLYEKMQEINETKKLVRKTPTLNDVTMWVDQAKKLPRIIEY